MADEFGFEEDEFGFEEDGFEFEEDGAELALQEEDGGIGETALDTLTSMGRGAAMGFSDELAGLAGLMMPDPTSDVDEELAAKGFDIPQESLLEEYRAARDAARAEETRVGERSPIASTVGELAGGIGTGLPAAARMGAIKAGALAGGLGGLGTSEAELPEGEVLEAVSDVAVGAGLGAGVGAAGKGLMKAATKTGQGVKSLKDFARTVPIVGKAMRSAESGYEMGKIGKLLNAENVSEEVKREATKLQSTIQKALDEGADADKALRQFAEEAGASTRFGDELAATLKSVEGRRELIEGVAKDRAPFVKDLKQLMSKGKRTTDELGEEIETFTGPSTKRKLDELDVDDMSPSESEDLLDVINRYTDVGSDPSKAGDEVVERAAKELAGGLRTKSNVAVDEAMGMPGEAGKLKQQLSRLMSAKGLMKVKDRSGSAEEVSSRQLDDFRKFISRQGKSSEIDRDTAIDFLKKYDADQGTSEFKGLEETLTKLGDLSEATSKTGEFGADIVRNIARLPGAVTNLAGLGVKKGSGAVASVAKSAPIKAVGKAIDSIADMQPEQIRSYASQIKIPGYQRALSQIADSNDPVKRKALMFGLSQQPAFRKAINELQETMRLPTGDTEK